MKSGPPLPVPERPLPAALLCDMDGTLVDTERDWLATVADLLAAHGTPAAGPEGPDSPDAPGSSPSRGSRWRTRPS